MVTSVVVADRMVKVTEINTMMGLSVPLPPPEENQSSSGRRLWWSLPLLTLGLLLPSTLIVASLVPVRLWQLAPGSVQTVADRLSFDERVSESASVYPATNSIRFVTALGSKLSALDSLVGVLDSDVEVQTYEERFGRETPGSQQRIGTQSMTTSKEIAEYVALKMLGYPVSFTYGDVVVQDLVCLEDPSPRSACNVLEPGDVIVAVDGQATPTLEELVDVMADKKPNQDISLTVVAHQSGDRESRRVTLISSPDDPERTIIGFIPVDTRTVNLPFEVEIDTDSIGGPSAGLAFTLALLDEMTPGDLFGGRRVVATGTVNDDGSVGPIGALVQKSVAVQMSDADVFLVPASQDEDELVEARRILGKSVRLVTVTSVEEALTTLIQMGGSGLENATIDL